jgi:hypothetical protein
MKLNQRKPLALTKCPWLERIAIDATGGNARPPSAFDGVVHSDHNGTIGHEAGYNNRQQPRSQRARVPTRAIEKLMVDGKVGRLGATQL